MSPSTDTPSEPGAGVPYSTVTYGDIDVCWLMELEGGGRTFGQSFLPVVEHLCGHVDRLFELCAGAGCIGFSLLAQDLCDTLVLSDVNPVAVAAARETVRRNGLEDRVTVYESDGLKDVPGEERCDLFIANPPFFTDGHVPSMRDRWGLPETALRAKDPGLELHQSLYGEMARILKPGGSVLFQETALGTSPADFMPMIEAGGMQHIRTLWYTESRRFAGLYFMWSKLASPTLLTEAAGFRRARVELRDPSPPPMAIPTRAVHLLTLCNLTTRAVSVKADLSGDSSPELERPLVEILPGDELALPPLTLGAGRSIAFHEEHSRTTLATVIAE